MRERLSLLWAKKILSFALALLMILILMPMMSMEVKAAGSSTLTITQKAGEPTFFPEYSVADIVDLNPDDWLVWHNYANILPTPADPANAFYYPRGTNGSITVRPKTGYVIEQVEFETNNGTLTDTTAPFELYNSYSGASLTSTISEGISIPGTYITRVTVTYHATAFTVTFDANGHGTAPTAISGVTSGDKITAPTAPTEAGYTFGGWYKEAGCTNAWNFTSDTVTANTTLYAKWTADTYTVTFDANGHGTDPSPTSGVAYGATITAPTAPTEAGYTFGGWYKESSCTNAWNFTSDIVTADITLYAKWTADLAGTATISPSTIRFGDTLTVVPALTNQVGTLSYQWQRFEGGAWVDIAGATGTTYTPVASDINKSFIVKITSSGNSGFIMSSATFGLAKANGPIPPSVLGVACTTASNNDGKITGTDTTMEYATNASFSSATDCVGTEITGLTPGRYYVRVKETATHLAGSYAQVTVGGYTPGTPVTYTVSFNANGGTGTHSDATGISGSYTLPTTTTFTAPSGKVFDGWSESVGGAKIATSTITIAANKTLYAVWKTATPAPTPTPTPSEPSTPSVEEKPATKTVEVNVTYTVARGDTMSKIAKRNGLTLAELKALNPQIKNINVIYSGQVINVGKTTKEVPASETPEKEVPKQTLPDAYIVEKGDSLSKIAKRYNMTLAELVKKNPQIKNINLIRVGEKINIQ